MSPPVPVSLPVESDPDASLPVESDPVASAANHCNEEAKKDKIIPVRIIGSFILELSVIN